VIVESQDRGPGAVRASRVIRESFQFAAARACMPGESFQCAAGFLGDFTAVFRELFHSGETFQRYSLETLPGVKRLPAGTEKAPRRRQMPPPAAQVSRAAVRQRQRYANGSGTPTAAVRQGQRYANGTAVIQW